MGGGSALGGAGGGDEATQELAAAVESLPKLLDQKKGLEMHTNILKVMAVFLRYRLCRRDMLEFDVDSLATKGVSLVS